MSTYGVCIGSVLKVRIRPTKCSVSDTDPGFETVCLNVLSPLSAA